jgi:hypothetical protein
VLAAVVGMGLWLAAGAGPVAAAADGGRLPTAGDQRLVCDTVGGAGLAGRVSCFPWPMVDW